MIRPKIVFFCLLSNKSAIGDAFLDLVVNFPDEIKKSILVVKTKKYPDELFGEDIRFVNLAISKTDISIISIFEFLFSAIKLLFLCFGAKCFVFGVSPLNHLLSLFVLSREKLFWVHDPDLHPGAYFPERFAHRLLRLFSLLIPSAKFCVASDFLKDRLASNFYLYSSPIVIPFPYIEQIVCAASSQDFEHTNAPILFFGRLEPYKGLDRLYAALLSLKKKGLECHCVIAGKGKELAYSSLPNVTHINKYVSNESLKNLITNCQVCVFPYSSGTGTQALQTALALGAPCIVSDLPTFREIARQVNNVGVYFFKDQDEFEILLSRFVNHDYLIDNQKIKTVALEVFSTALFSSQVAKTLTS